MDIGRVDPLEGLPFDKFHKGRWSAADYSRVRLSRADSVGCRIGYLLLAEPDLVSDLSTLA